jgi:Protein of unknown function (DUF3574)
MTQTTTLAAAGLACFLLGAGAVTAYRSAVPGEGAPGCRTGSAAMARVELLFGTGRKDGGAVGEVEWQAFMDGEVTPRFPDGLTVLTGYGQWRDKDSIVKEGSRILLIWYPRTTESEGKIEAVRKAYKARFGQDSVMRVDGLSCVSF